MRRLGINSGPVTCSAYYSRSAGVRSWDCNAGRLHPGRPDFSMAVLRKGFLTCGNGGERLHAACVSEWLIAERPMNKPTGGPIEVEK